jgi:asparagine synthase (glutamine-hydrolysing)
MCGIAGFVGLGYSDGDARARVRAMCDAITHRGPDSEGVLVDRNVALGMRRLSVIDVMGGHQPIFNEDRSVAVVFNGEIYNHRVLRAELERHGHRFTTHSDTEVLVHAYEQFGEGMAVRLHGMFAFAIWDFSRQSLFIARDRVGMKPLSYAEVGGGLAFCSELRSLLAVMPEQLRVAPESVMQYLAFGYVPDPNSIFAGVRKLPPGHWLKWSQGRGVSVQRFWSAPTPSDRPPPEEDVIEEMRTRLDAAVASHLESEVPLGAFLSGGLDSSTVVALMARHAAGRVKTFSIGFSEDAFDESPAARAVAEAFGTDHTELVVTPDVERLFEDVISLFDEPFADSSAIPTFLVSQLARQSVTVALSGDGGDELFGGYTRYAKVLGDRMAPPRVMGRLAASMGLMLPHFFPGRNKLVNLGRSRLGRYAATVVQPVRIDEGGVASTLHPGAAVHVADQLARYADSNLAPDFAAAMMRIDLENYLPGDILTKVDRTSMSVSLEARVPLLDFELVDFAMRIPGDLRVTADESKRLFRRAIRGIVPDFVLSRPKAGFEIPLGRWFRGPLRHRIEALRQHNSPIGEYVEQAAVQRLVAEHGVGRRDHSAALWRLMVLEFWLESLQAGRLSRSPRIPLATAA